MFPAEDAKRCTKRTRAAPRAESLYSGASGQAAALVLAPTYAKTDRLLTGKAKAMKGASLPPPHASALSRACSMMILHTCAEALMVHRFMPYLNMSP